ncbi:MAG: hypothetical protein DRP09_10465 [Candidatus Thorarchaeota archaeon]|nr:MAG: hypothetical protein DRP09_10465 [Candidatus Thorarchaeota archaeon]
MTEYLFITFKLEKNCERCQTDIKKLRKSSRMKVLEGKKHIMFPKILEDEEIVLRPNMNPFGTIFGYHISVRKRRD